MDADDHPLTPGAVDVLVHRQDAKAEARRGRAHPLDPDPHADLAGPVDRLEVLEVVGADEVMLVVVGVEVEASGPAEMPPEGADRVLEEEQIAGVVEDLKGVQIVEVHPVDQLKEAHAGGG